MRRLPAHWDGKVEEHEDAGAHLSREHVRNHGGCDHRVGGLADADDAAEQQKQAKLLPGDEGGGEHGAHPHNLAAHNYPLAVEAGMEIDLFMFINKK